MMTIPNCISLLRIPLAFFFLQQNVFYRFLAIFIAMLSDGLDGFLARRTKSCSRLGTTLDPMTDKFFVFFVMGIFIQEQRLSLLEATSMLCRDFSNILFAIYLIFSKQWETYRFRAIWCGKLTTFFQFILLLALTYGLDIPEYVYYIFILFGSAALVEFYLSGKRSHQQKSIT
ncbi:putative CDP-diacylglycerol-glycerol-3-phosphate 3-phosphatidyltransferase [Chlamydiales bacterium STE3]|nr:putative CDP-diacylglycerol-glycerol-3-phosphate 3-phosphatidyltransferase [Chlamydiales bacterium STE3]